MSEKKTKAELTKLSEIGEFEVINHITKDFKIKNLRAISSALDDISKLITTKKYINNKLIISWISNYKDILKHLNVYAAKKNLLSFEELKILKFYRNY